MKMKTKKWLTISLWLTVPAILSLMINMVVSFSYWSDYSIEEIKKLNHPFAFWAAIVGWISVGSIAYTVLRFMTYAADIDDLEAAKDEYNKATREMEKARDKYTELISETV